MTYRILSLDGGGVRGLFTIVLLQRLDEAFPGWLKKVDLLAGTSTGGVIAIGLAAGLAPRDLRHLYYHHMRRVFQDSLLDDLADLGRVNGAEYSISPLEKVLYQYLGDRPLGTLEKKVLIPAFDLDNRHPDPMRRSWKPKFFHNFPGDDSDEAIPAYKAAVYTSAAPTYFPSEDGFIDGGVVAPNPSMAAIAQTQDTRSALDPRPTLADLRVLSLGTGGTRRFIQGDRLDWGYLQWAQPLSDLVLQGASGVAEYQASQLLGERYHRLAPTLPPGIDIPMDAWKKRDDLVHFAEVVPLESAVEWLGNYWEND